MAPRKSYTASFKLAAIEKAESIGNRKAASEFGIDEKCIRRWRLQKDALKSMPKQKRAQRGRAVAYPNLEENLEAWILEQREKGLPLSTVKIRLHAKIIAQQMGLCNFKGGPSWCHRFMRRKRLSVRSKTTVGQKLPDDWMEKKASFLEYTTKIIKEDGLTNSQLINMDEVPLTFDCPPSRTVDKQGEKTISIVTSGNEKTSFTCVLACAANGDKLKPLLIFKRKTVPKGNFPSDVVICANQKGWMCEPIMIQWIQEIYRKRKGAFFQPKGLLILDSMRAHLLDSVKSECKKISTKLAIIPGGLTKILQPLDLVINRAFKHHMRRNWENWMREGLHSFTNSGRMRKATYEEVAKWVSDSWKNIDTTTIISGFSESGIIEKDVVDQQMIIDSDDEHSDENDEFLNLFCSDSDNSEFSGFE